MVRLLNTKNVNSKRIKSIFYIYGYKYIFEVLEYFQVYFQGKKPRYVLYSKISRTMVSYKDCRFE